MIWGYPYFWKHPYEKITDDVHHLNPKENRVIFDIWHGSHFSYVSCSEKKGAPIFKGHVSFKAGVSNHQKKGEFSCLEHLEIDVFHDFDMTT